MSRRRDRFRSSGSGLTSPASPYAPVLYASPAPIHSTLSPGLNGESPDPALFRKYMAARKRLGHIPTLLRDWVTAHPNYHAEALEQVRNWIEENRHLFKRKGAK
jgi:hypothetical protein